jgi:hypothetical protein
LPIGEELTDQLAKSGNGAVPFSDQR